MHQPLEIVGIELQWKSLGMMIVVGGLNAELANEPGNDIMG